MAGGDSRLKWTDEQLDALHAEVTEVREELKKTASIQYVGKTATRLYGNALNVAKQLTIAVAFQLYGLGLVVFALRPDIDGRDTYVNYIQPKLESAKAGINSADTVDKVMEIYRNFMDECWSYLNALGVSKRDR